MWSVNTGRVLDARLGYFINPLRSVLLGYAVLQERPRPLQWAALALAAGGVLWLAWQGQGHFGRPPLIDSLWLLLAGPVTAVPLLLFAAGARRVSLATVGLLQYGSPSIQFVLAVFLYKEPFSTGRSIGFVLIRAALALYSAESLRVLRHKRRAAAAAAATAAAA